MSSGAVVDLLGWMLVVVAVLLCCLGWPFSFRELCAVRLVLLASPVVLLVRADHVAPVVPASYVFPQIFFRFFGRMLFLHACPVFLSFVIGPGATHPPGPLMSLLKHPPLFPSIHLSAHRRRLQPSDLTQVNNKHARSLEQLNTLSNNTLLGSFCKHSRAPSLSSESSLKNMNGCLS